MLGRNAKRALAATQNIEHIEFAQEIARGFVEAYQNYVDSSDGKTAHEGNI